MTFQRLDLGRQDYMDNIVLLDPSSGEIPDGAGVVEIGADEPLFLLRAQDILAADMVRAWAKRLEQLGGDHNAIEHARRRADVMDGWRREFGGQIPDLP